MTYFAYGLLGFNLIIGMSNVHTGSQTSVLISAFAFAYSLALVKYYDGE